MHTKNTKRLGVMLISSSLITAAHAIGPGFYMGAQAGSTNLNNTPQAVQTGLSSPLTVPVTPSNTGIGERFFMGAGVNKYAAIEFGFTHYAPSTYKPSPSGLSNTPTISENGVDLTGKAMYPFESVAVFGKLGVTSIRQTLSGSLKALPPAPQQSGSSQHVRPLIGVGISYELTPNWVTDLSWTRALKGGNGFQNADLMAVGIAYHFVDKFCGQFLC